MSNQHAKALGRLGKGKLKSITDAERRRRAERLAIARQKRWEPKPLTNIWFDFLRKCERCGKQTTGYDLYDYCANCSRNLCTDCMQNGCCGHTPAESGEAQSETEYDAK